MFQRNKNSGPPLPGRRCSLLVPGHVFVDPGAAATISLKYRQPLPMPAVPTPPPRTTAAADELLPLPLALNLRWARTDVAALALVAVLELCILAAGLAHGTLGARGVAGTVVVVGLNVATWAAAAHRPLAYAARWRLPLVTVTRAANMILYPSSVDLLSVMTGRPLAASGPAAAAAAARTFTGSSLASAALYTRAAALFLIPVAGVHACQLTALYFQLPPLAHLAVQLASVASLMHRAPTGASVCCLPAACLCCWPRLGPPRVLAATQPAASPSG